MQKCNQSAHRGVVRGQVVFKGRIDREWGEGEERTISALTHKTSIKDPRRGEEGSEGRAD